MIIVMIIDIVTSPRGWGDLILGSQLIGDGVKRSTPEGNVTGTSYIPGKERTLVMIGSPRGLKILRLCGWLLGAGGVAIGAEQAYSSGQIPDQADVQQGNGISFFTDASLTYLDAFSPKVFNRDSAMRTQAGSGLQAVASPSEMTRTLGLRRFRTEVAWDGARDLQMHAVFRPDAVNRMQTDQVTGVVREFDDRAGDQNMPPMPQVKLLDAYDFEFRRGPNLCAALGVWQSMGIEQVAYPQVFGFGLAPLLPAKFMGTRVLVRAGGELTNRDSGVHGRDALAQSLEQVRVKQGASAGILTTELYIFQGREERGESWGYKASAGDRAPVSGSASPGAAVATRWRLASSGGGAWAGGEIALLGGMTESIDDVGHHSQVFGQAGLGAQGQVGFVSYKGALDLRYVHDGWRRVPEPVSDLRQMSVRATAALSVYEPWWILAGGGWGKNQRWQSEALKSSASPLDGREIEGGVAISLNGALSFEFLVASEWRDFQMTDGSLVGAFTDGELSNAAAPRQRVVKRMGVELNYQIGKST